MSTHASPASAGTFQLTADQVEIRDMARTFAVERLAPNAIEWDHEKHFPTDV
ncbi:MAG: acyl-CoA dehydrogenase family protein, partial [Gaiellales bacterium]